MSVSPSRLPPAATSPPSYRCLPSELISLPTPPLPPDASPPVRLPAFPPLLTLSGSSGAPRGKYATGFVLTLAASATFALILSLLELAFEKVVRSRTLRWVLTVLMHTNLVASAVSVLVLFTSGEWRTIPREMAVFRNGRARYVLTLVGAAAAWQAQLAGQVRLIARVSSLFAYAMGNVQLPLVPVFAVVLFDDRMTGIKAVAMLMAVLGFLSYVYQHNLNGRRAAAAVAGKAEEEAQCCVYAQRTAADEVSHA